MAPEASNKPIKAGLSLYANLLDSASTDDTAPGTISRAPIVFKRPLQGDDLQQDEAFASKQQISAASLRFQPTKRPQLIAQKPKSKPLLHKGISTSSSKEQETHILDAPSTTIRSSGKSTLADWAAEGEEDEASSFYVGEKRQRGGRKKRKKTKEDPLAFQNWDDIYDPSRPNSYEEYKNSDEKISEMRDWKDRLYAHRMARSHSSDIDDFEEVYKPAFTNGFNSDSTSLIAPVSENHKIPTTADFGDTHPRHDGPLEGKHPNAVSIDDPGLPAQSSSKEAKSMQSPVTFANVSQSPLHEVHGPPITTAPPPVISRAPVRYNLSLPPSELPTSEAEFESVVNEDKGENAPRSLRPGQQGFAQRLMSKYGWTKGEGLGASGTGIVNPLRVQVEKQKRKPDSEGGGFVGPGGKGKIVGDNKKGGSSATQTSGKFGVMSEVVILSGMIDGMDLDVELEEASQGGLIQEIGEECGEKYGRVERVYIDRSIPSKPLVFVKFTSQLSALRAVNALEQRIFNGNTITARFYDLDKFETGIYS